jgi:hypothetical protein
MLSVLVYRPVAARRRGRVDVAREAGGPVGAVRPIRGGAAHEVRVELEQRLAERRPGLALEGVDGALEVPAVAVGVPVQGVVRDVVVVDRDAHEAAVRVARAALQPELGQAEAHLADLVDVADHLAEHVLGRRHPGAPVAAVGREPLGLEAGGVGAVGGGGDLGEPRIAVRQRVQPVEVAGIDAGGVPGRGHLRVGVVGPGGAAARPVSALLVRRGVVEVEVCSSCSWSARSGRSPGARRSRSSSRSCRRAAARWAARPP